MLLVKGRQGAPMKVGMCKEVMEIDMMGRKQDEEAYIKQLQDEIESLLMILDNLHDNIIITDYLGNVLNASTTFQVFYGYERKDLINKSIFQLKSDGVFDTSAIEQVIETGQQETKEQTYHDKRIVVTAVPIYDDDKKMVKIISFTRDITEFFELKKQYSALEYDVEKYAQEVKDLRGKYLDNIEGVIYKSTAIETIINKINHIAPFDASVLFTGESGVGKTMFAKVLHKKSRRRDGPFIEVNCAAIPDSLFESELFGYEKGAFTGASQEGKIGLIEMANGGTLFLDEISELPLHLQTKLLKVLQDKTIIRIGGKDEINIDFRLVTATNRQLKKQVNQKKFREDLYYRINLISIDVPPLRERNEDIIPIAAEIVDRFNKKYDLNKQLTPKVYHRLAEYDWPGNVRELNNEVEKLLIMSTEDIITDMRDSDIFTAEPKTRIDLDKSFKQSMKEYEKFLIVQAYRKYGSSVKVAKALGISQPSASRKIRDYILKPEQD